MSSDKELTPEEKLLSVIQSGGLEESKPERVPEPQADTGDYLHLDLTDDEDGAPEADSMEVSEPAPLNVPPKIQPRKAAKPVPVKPVAKA